MPNRIIKESICTSETIDNLTSDEECFFYRIIVNCDDFGRLDARIPVITSKCYPLKSSDSKRKQVEKMLISLQKVNLIFLYHAGKYLQVKNWNEHQQIRAKRSKYPSPDDSEINGNHMISNDSICARNPIQSNRESSIHLLADADIKTKQKFAEFVSLTQDEHSKLVEQFGEDGTKDKIEALNLWKGSKGKKTASDYLTILNWARRDKNTNSIRAAPKESSSPASSNRRL